MFNFLRNYGIEKTVSAKKLIRSFTKFEKRFPNEEDSVEYFARAVMREFGVTCRICSSSMIDRKYGSRFYRCLNCRSKGWIFSGTFFEKMRIAKLWNAAIWLHERRIQFNAWQLAELCQVAYSSALVINRKIAKVICSMVEDSSELVPSEVFATLFRKRSIETPAKVHPRFEQLVSDQSRLQLQKEQNAEDVDHEVPSVGADFNAYSDLEHKVLALLSENPVHFDEICRQLLLPGGTVSATLIMLELGDAIVRRPGDNYTLKPKPEKLSSGMKDRQDLIKAYISSSRVEDFFKFAIRNFHGFSRKYLQFYLTKFQAVFQDGFMTPGRILRECLNLKSFSYYQMLEYVSPEDVVMWV
ncbi:MAG: hypothetical protein SFY67_15810 [Candidatus Melainabacteria bacterium]|nr:hypothetical protein [Candidatus Melainabacteria bacterium]